MHKRCFEKRQIIQNPLHSEGLLQKTMQFKMQRIYQLIASLDPSLRTFLHQQEDELGRLQAAYELFRLLKSHSKAMLISAVRELTHLRCFRLKALRSLLNLPEPKQADPLWPQNRHLLNLNYEERRLEDYDRLS